MPTFQMSPPPPPYLPRKRGRVGRGPILTAPQLARKPLAAAFPALSDQLIFTPAVWATFAHFSISAPMKAPNSAAVIDSGTTPCFAQDSLISVELRIFRISALRRSMIGFGVAAGATMPTQPDAWKP